MIRSLLGCSRALRSALVEEAVCGIHEAGNPYFDYFFGDGETARRILLDWMRRPSSEVALERIRILLDGEDCRGGFIALSGAELQTCRGADTLAAMRFHPAQRPDLLERLRRTSDLFVPVEPHDFYLSKMWVAPSHRGSGYGGQLVAAYLEEGHAQGCRRFRLDVSSENERAIAIYRSHGFRILKQTVSHTAKLSYLAMVRDALD